MRILVIIALFLLVMPVAFALDISEVQFLSHGQPIGEISHNKIPNVDLKVTVIGSDFSSLKADLSGITKDQSNKLSYKTKVPMPSNCEKQSDDSTFICYFRELELWIPADTVNMTFSLYNASGSLTVVNKTNTFTIDDTKPQIVNINTNRCDSTGNCYISSNQYTNITIDFQDSKATFNKKLVKYSLAGKTYYVTNCTGMSCVGISKITCTSGQNIPIKLLTSYDDAYNKVNNSNTFIENIVCDNDAPTMINLTVAADSGFNVIKSKDTLKIILTLQNELPLPKVKANLSELGITGLKDFSPCVKKGDNLQCELSIGIARDGPYTANLEIIAEDIAGNKLVIPKAIQVLGLDESEAPDLWTISQITQSPTLMSKNHLKFPRIIYIDLKLTPKKGTPSIINIKDNFVCKAVEGFGSNDDIQDGEILNNIPGVTDVYITVMLKQGDYSNITKVKYNCSIDILSKSGSYVTSSFENENFFIEINFDMVNSLNDQIANEIQASIAETESLRQTVQDIRKIINPIMDVCNVVVGIKAVSGVLGGAELASSWVADIPAIGTILSAVPMLFGSTSFLTAGAGESIAAVVVPFCEIAVCQSKINTYITDAVGKLPLLEEGAKIAGYSSYSAAMNPYDNIVMSVAMLCVPGIVVNLEKMNSINCAYTECLARDVRDLGLPISECENTRSYAKCKYVFGTVFNVIPYTAILKSIGESAKAILSDPVTFLTTAGMSIYCGAGFLFPESTVLANHGVCAMASSVTSITQLYGIINSMINPSFHPETENYCNDINKAIDANGYWVGKPNQPAVFSKQEKMDFGGTATDCRLNVGCGFGAGENKKPIYYVQSIKGTDGEYTDLIRNADGQFIGTDAGLIKLASKNGITLNFDGSIVPGNPATESTAASTNTPLVDNEGKTVSGSENGLLKLLGLSVKQQKPVMDADGEPVIGADGKPVMESLTLEEIIQNNFKDSRSYNAYVNQKMAQRGGDVLKSWNEYQASLVDYSTNLAIKNKDYQTAQTRYDAAVEFRTALKERNSIQQDITDYEKDHPDDKSSEEYKDLTTAQTAAQNKIDVANNKFVSTWLDKEQHFDLKVFDRLTTTADGNTPNYENEYDVLDEMIDGNGGLDDTLNTAEKDLKELVSAPEDRFDDFKTEDLFDAAWGSGFLTAVSTTVNFGKTVGLVGPTLSNLISSEWSKNWKASIDNAFASEPLSLVVSPESNICDSNTVSDSQPSSPLIRSGVMGYYPAAHIEGSKYSHVDIDGKLIYEYIISGAVTPGKNDGLRFKIFIGNNDITPVDNKIIELNQNPFKFSGESSIFYNSTINHQTVCIKFLNTNLRNFFDDISALDGGSLCQTIVLEGT